MKRRKYIHGEYGVGLYNNYYHFTYAFLSGTSLTATVPPPGRSVHKTLQLKHISLYRILYVSLPALLPLLLLLFHYVYVYGCRSPQNTIYTARIIQIENL